MIRGAIKDKKNRYQLWRIWDIEQPLILFILLNPSHADDQYDDRTVKKLISFSKKFAFGGFYLGNLYAYVTPYPSPEMFVCDDQTNIKHIEIMKKKCMKTVVGWGNLGTYPEWLKNIVCKPMCFGTNKNGTPKHPLYLPSNTKLQKYLD